ncbi:hypothetical protein J2Z44_003936 [Clostridium punense]|uniref:Uncharacterized protein n=1 Tax=Clostridium punense TaxID=1054297 RepID=A0ABS4K8H5_9CLOT|nr:MULTISPECIES: hypothetical protein [Clostridium]EQB89220.1 hypothetical protein M918_21325 [Clostridium sp. BL8]MBP2024086.1 hypothetical protein [Clostridium punense]
MSTQDLLQSLMNDPEVKELLTRLNAGENINNVLGNNEVQNSYSLGNIGCCPMPQPKPRNNDFGLAIVLLLLFCCCGCGGGFFCC